MPSHIPALADDVTVDGIGDGNGVGKWRDVRNGGRGGVAREFYSGSWG